MKDKNKRFNHSVRITTALYRAMDQLSAMEASLKRALLRKDHEKIIESEQVRYLKKRALWSQSFDTVTSLLVRSIFTVLSRIKHVFGIKDTQIQSPSLPCSLSSVHPSDENPNSRDFISRPYMERDELLGLFGLSSDLLKPLETTLGFAGLGLYYANLIVVVEKMIGAPQLVGGDSRDDLMWSLKKRLRGVGFWGGDRVFAGEWREALVRILGWLLPLAHNMIKWQSERSFEKKNLMPKSSNVLLLQTLCFANKAKTEAAITELLVGLNYLWRFHREMNSKSWIGCTQEQ